MEEEVLEKLSLLDLEDDSMLEKLHDNEYMLKVITELEEKNDIAKLQKLIEICSKDEELINKLIRTNRSLLKVKLTKFRIALILNILERFSSVNKEYFVSLTYLLPYLSDTDIRAMVIVTTIKLKELDSQQLSLTILNFLEQTTILQNKQLLFDSLYLLFPVLPSLIAEFVLNSQDFLNLMSSLQVSTLNDQLIISVLKFFNTCCIEESIRQFIIKDYYKLLLDQLSNSKHEKLIALILTKLNNYTEKKIELEKLNQIFIDGLLKDEDLDVCLEGILYVSLKVKMKESLRSNIDLISKVTDLIANNDNSIKFGALSILLNLSSYEEQKLGPNVFDGKDDKSQIESFLKSLQDKISDLISNCKSINLQNELMKLLSNFIQIKSLTSSVIKQGGLKFILNYLTATSVNLKYDKSTLSILNKDQIQYPEIRQLAIDNLLRLLMNNNPKLIFDAKNPSQTCIPYLCEALANDVSDKEKFEILIALINLSSMNDLNTNNLIIRLSFDTLKDLMVSSNTQLAKSTIELVANLCLSPVMISKFFNFEIKEHEENFETLLNLLNNVNVDIQCSVLNIFANVSEHEPICDILLKQDRLVELLIEFLQDPEYLDNEEFLVRLVYIFMNLMVSIQDKADEVDRFKRNDLKNGMLSILQTSKDEEILQMCINICNIIQFTK